MAWYYAALAQVHFDGDDAGRRDGSSRASDRSRGCAAVIASFRLRTP